MKLLYLGSIALFCVVFLSGCAFYTRSEPPNGTFNLTVDKVKKDSATFSWQISTDLLEGDQFRFVMGEQKDPTVDGESQWYQIDNDKRKATWTDLPPGKWHVRLCTFNTMNDPARCLFYSNDVVVEIQ
ncbi:MAG: hypothetical protein GW939_03065 [Candidatus Magasanikbacteria bacterium]|uniref:Uncharacterized protein n=1 Tax=Candidatus Magasanikbacteria bacterium CG10_big_fil_rev_8_21_14_0_10_38_6 TaxID=1974647 RepID=A0A2M6P0Z2_9BACT|nr:hypothetical protein [Candidatus Magasanikbacteria bacterium]NCS72131.1 hypothetical protein [Candidatus Magasanikbacteria bacterium]PIR77402.1 MAG: hypothetical protein COU30_02670 [Candidatus Magasanikbacteria bacterium CG10_big_fil_rev_8_21_14_0_10_38_6]